MTTIIDPDDLVGKVVTHPSYRGVYLHVDELAFADVEVLVDEYVDEDGNCWPTYDTDEQPTGDIACHMIGDNRRIILSPDDCTVIDDEDDICWSCGQVGCGWH